ncbi:MAG: T9SS type A sorting domain-containing protein, partial [Bacteroidota bacterium]
DSSCIQTGSTIIITEPVILAVSIAATTDVSCNGGSNGSVTLSVSGGTVPYSYLWDDPDSQTSISATGLTAGIYSITVTDSLGCVDTDSATITQPDTLITSIAGTNIACNGGNNGSANLTVSGGTLPYTYLWSNSATSEDIINLTPLTYTVLVTDANGCTDNDTIIITQPNALFIIISGTDLTCNGGNDGAVDLTVSGGTIPYTYVWSNGDSIQDPSGIPAGSYTITVTDANGCMDIDGTTISEPPPLALTFTTNSPVCNGSCDGTATAIATLGSLPYNYIWDNGQITPTATGLCAGTHGITVIDNDNCSISGNAILNDPVELTINVSSSDASCGNADGNASVSISSGTPPYSYQWSSGDTLSTADSLASGIYIVTVTDNNSCSNFSAVTISDAGGATLNINSVTQVTCHGSSDGAIDINVSGGTAPYTYAWSNGSTSEDINNLVAGPYEINVTDANNCLSANSIIITEPDFLILNVTTTDANCASSDGGATVNVSGGTGVYTYSWSSGGTGTAETGLTSGVYIVTVTDANGCIKSAAAAISDIGGATVIVDSIVDVGCGGAGGSVYISVTGGTAPYSYNWSNADTTEDMINDSAGIYDVFVTDAGGCIATASAAISEIPLSAQSICLVTVDSITGRNLVVWDKVSGQSFNIYKESTQSGVYYLIGNVPFADLSEFVDTLSNPLQRSWRYKISVLDACGNESDLSQMHKTMHLTINEGLGGTINLIWDHYEGFTFFTYYIYRYTTSTGWEAIDSIPNNLTSYTDFAPPIGNLFYQVLVKSPGVCTSTAKAKDYNSSKSNTSSISGAVALSVTTTTTVATFGNCDGSATVTASGGTPPYTYLWDDPNSQTTQAATGLCAGNYSVTVFDANGDSIVASVTVTESPATLSAVTTSTNASQGNCDGTATVTASGGVPPYTYLWDDSLSQTTTIAGSLCAGNYNVTVFDSIGDSIVASVTVGESIAPMSATTTTTNASQGNCDGDATVTPCGGVPPYTYQWDASAGSQADSTATGLCAGNYDVTVYDTNGDSIVASVIVGETGGPLMTAMTYSDASYGNCDGTANVSVSGGYPPYTFLWDDTLGQTTAMADSLCPGTYTVTATDSSGSTTADTVIISELPEPMSVTTTTTNASQGNCDGDATVTPSGGVPPYTYQWDASAGSQADSTATGLCAGNYDVTVYDTNGDSIVASVTVSETVDPLTTTMTSSDASYDNCDGTATVSVSGGYTPYTYLWNDPGSQTSTTATGLCEGTYIVTITDSIDSTITATVTISELPSTLAATAIATSTDQIPCNGTATADATGGNPPYTYQWDDPGSQASITATGLCGGLYTVTVTDNSGSTTTASATVDVIPGISDVDNENRIEIYPNPNKGIFNLEIYLEENEDITIGIFDMRGQLIYSDQTGNFSGLIEKQIDLSGYSGSIYHLQVITKEGVINRKVVIE